MCTQSYPDSPNGLDFHYRRAMPCGKKRLHLTARTGLIFITAATIMPGQIY
jgi:hypothetical protein